ncbi:DUF2577 domain-containing protein [Paenibacillus glycinis]|uniref:DUF2577 domain-containing protein n=1 Tax=Paenibacillus glycinis TaxID=2697035 RepID=A0ABW9XNV8_9BACL|nr:DUF2577 domain-containing protein [Paenibacillus glycinis]NBD24317.1 DUF2577 domain-containing protein [Paenibacillus glycinis]
MSLNETIKQITKGYLASVKLADVQYGTVSRLDPLEVSVNERLALPEDFLVVPEHMTAFKVTVGAQEVEIRTGLAVGDRVVLIREQGGLNYVIAGRLTG